ncbi:MAG: zinc-binding dehydrogenase [Gaiellaceae bacterium]
MISGKHRSSARPDAGRKGGFECARSWFERPAVDRGLPLEQAAEAHRLIDARQVLGKIVLKSD